MTRETPKVERDGAVHDFDLHGVVGIRLRDARDGDVAMVSRQLGPLDGRLETPPDITIRFVDRVTERPLTHVGVGDAGFNEDGFFVVNGRGGVKALIPMADLGERPEIVCERGLPAVPHLLATINFTALSKGVLPLHASAFTVGDRGVLVTGWAKSGKTESLLAAAASDGGRYVGDEWVYLTPEGEMLGLPEPIRLWSWHLEQLPWLLRSRPAGDRTRLACWRALSTLTSAAATWSAPGSGLARRGAPLVARQAYLRIPPAELFGPDRMALRARLDSTVLVMSHGDPEVRTRRAGPTEVGDRMAASLADERRAFLDHYRQFRYAFPGRVSPLVERAPAMEARLLSALFDHRPASTVTHPYPCDIAALGRAVLRAARDLSDGAQDVPTVSAS